VLVVVSVAALLVFIARDDNDGDETVSVAATTVPQASIAPTTKPASGATTAPAARGPRGSGQAVTFAFAGDVQFPDVQDTDPGVTSTGLPVLADQLKADPTGVLAPITPVLSGADIAMVNLETAVATGGTPEPKQYNFRAPATAFEALRVAGVDVVTMANNHGRDYGAAGFAETLAAKQQTPVAVVGIGANAAEAYRPWVTEVKGQRLAFFGATDVLDDWLIASWTATDAQPGLASTKDANLERLLAAIRAERPNADTIVVNLHWGSEGDTCPTPRQQEVARALVATGADVVVGSHAHRVQTAGRLDGALVDYGLGNFIFYNESGLSGVTGVLRVTVTGRDVDAYEWLPARISGGVPRLLSGDAAASDNAAFASRRACAGLQP